MTRFGTYQDRSPVYWCRQFGVSYRQVDHWCRLGRLGDVEGLSQGSGVYRQFSLNNVFRLAVLAEVSRLWSGGMRPPSFVDTVVPTLELVDHQSSIERSYGDAIQVRIDLDAIALKVIAMLSDAVGADR